VVEVFTGARARARARTSSALPPAASAAAYP